MNAKRISTGIQELDDLIEGGLRAGKPYLLVGEPGTGKTIFSLQFLYQGLMDGETVLYVAIDEKPTDIIDQGASLGWSLSPYIEAKKFLILDTSAYLNACATENRDVFAVQKVIGELNHRIRQIAATRVVIDPVGSLISTCDSQSRARDQARMLFYALQSNVETTTLLTTHSVGRNVRGLEEYLVAGTIVLEMELADSRFVRTLTIEKMRSTALDPAQYLFNIIREKGIVLQTFDKSLR